MTHPRPNILLVICHDLGKHLNCYGVPTVSSPNLDRLAQEGLIARRAFCTSPSCSPSRSSLFTGRYPHANGVMGLCHANWAWDLHREERHLGGLLHDAGYHTAALGVMHETHRPTEMGFDDCRAGAGHAHDMAVAAADFFTKRRGQAQPFYLQVGIAEPHRKRYGFVHGPDASKGVTVPPYLVDEISAREDFAYYQGAIRALDQAMGHILQSLQDNGLAENTLVIFTTDHGIPFPRAKCAVHDPGLEIALMLRWPKAGWTGGRSLDPLICNVDILPTLFDILGLPIPANIQGRSFAGLLNNQPFQPQPEVFGELTYHNYYDPRRTVRTDTHRLIVNFAGAHFLQDPSQQWRPKTVTRNPEEPAYARHPPIELYDLRTDPLEERNLAEFPEHATLLADLLGRLSRWMHETGDPLLHGVPISPMHRWALESLQTGQPAKR